MSDSESTWPLLSRRQKVALRVGWLAIIFVISTTILPMSHTTEAVRVDAMNPAGA